MLNVVITLYGNIVVEEAREAVERVIHAHYENVEIKYEDADSKYGKLTSVVGRVSDPFAVGFENAQVPLEGRVKGDEVQKLIEPVLEEYGIVKG